MVNASMEESRTEMINPEESTGPQQKPSFWRQIKVTPVTWIAAAICVLMFLLQLLVAPAGRLLGYPGLYTADMIWNGALWGLITPAFLHGDFLHILFNLAWLIYLGRLVEYRMGSKRFILFYLASAAVGSSVQLALSDGTGVGVSGVVCALFGYVWWMRPLEPLYATVITRQLILFFVGWLILCIPLTVFGVLNIANGAHFGGLIFGLGVAEAFYRTKEALWRWVFIGLVVLALLPSFYWPISPAWHYAAGREALRKGNVAEAIEHFSHGEEGNNGRVFLTGMQLVQLQMMQGQGEEAIESMEALAPIADKMPRGARSQFHNGFAWFLATASNAELRDGTRAVQEARLAAELTDHQEAAILDTLAAAHAEAGDFDQAVKWQKAALKENDNPAHKEEFEDRLKLYQERKPYRAPEF